MPTAVPVPIPVTFSVELEEIGPAEIAAWFFPPSEESVSPLFPPQWLLCIPGATYRGLAYFDRQVPATSPFAYSMARVLAVQGIGSVVIDNLGTGESHVPASASGWQLTRHVYADAYRQLIEQLRERLAHGTLSGVSAPVDARRLFLVAVGHSMGGLLATQLQASYGACDALCLLGWATRTIADHISLADMSMYVDTLVAAVPPSGYLPEMRSALRPFFFSSRVPAALIAVDEQEATIVPAGLLESFEPHALSEEATHIHCPLLLSFAADSEVTARPHDEVAAYPAAHALTLFVQSDAHHCANFAPTRFDLWDEIASWVRLKAVQTRGGVPLSLWQEPGDLFATQPLAS